MKKLKGSVSDRSFGVAGDNLAPVMHLIEARMGLRDLVKGTLNVKIYEDYIVKAGAKITPQEYGLPETIKLQRCLVFGHKAIIMRPDTHETIEGYGHGKNHLELMSPLHLRDRFNLKDGDGIIVELEGDDNWWDLGK